MSPIDIRRHYLAGHFDDRKATHYLILIGFTAYGANAFLHICH